MSKFTGIILAVAVWVSLIAVACGPAAAPSPTAAPKPTAGATRAAWETDWEQTVAAAKKEGGPVMVYSTPSTDVMAGVSTAFREKYGINVEYIVGRGEELAKRMQAEQNAGIFAADVVISGGTTGLVTMKPQGLLAPLEPLLILPEVLDAKVWRAGRVPFVDKDHYHLSLIGTAQRYVTRNTDMVKEEEIKSYKDLLNPKWKGKMVSNDPSIAGTASGMYTYLAYDVWGMEETLEFMRQMVKQEPAFTRDTRLQVEWVAKGKYPIGVATLQEQTQAFITVGSPIAHVKVIEGVKLGSGAGGLQIPKQQAHPNAAKVFVNWLLTREGLTVFVKGFGNPGSRVDIPTEGIPPSLFPGPDEKAWPDTEETVLARSVITDHARQIFGPLLK